MSPTATEDEQQLHEVMREIYYIRERQQKSHYKRFQELRQKAAQLRERISHAANNNR